MPQAGDLGQIQNQARTLYRGRVNVGFQSLASFNEGSSAPLITYPNMIWADTASNTIKQRNTSNTAWNIIGTQSDAWTFTNVNLPPNEFTTGDIKPTLKTVPDSGWVMVRDTSIGDALSRASERANADCEALFHLVWNNLGSNASVWSQSGTQTNKGSSSLADWAAHKAILLGPVCGRAIAVAGLGYGLSFRSLGATCGEESHNQTIDEMPSHTHFVQEYAGTGTAFKHVYSQTTVQNTDYWTGYTGGSRAFNVMQPTWFINLMCKL